MTRFSKWLDSRYVRWQTDQSRRARSQAHFARYLGISASNLSHYLRGESVPTGHNLDNIAKSLGIETYDYAGVPRPDKMVNEIRLIVEGMSDDSRRRVLAWLRNHEKDNAKDSESLGNNDPGAT